MTVLDGSLIQTRTAGEETPLRWEPSDRSLYMGSPRLS